MNDDNKPLVILKNISNHPLYGGCCFFSENTPGRDLTKLDDGTVAYEVVGYVDTNEEAQEIIKDRQPHFEQKYIYHMMRDIISVQGGDDEKHGNDC